MIELKVLLDVGFWERRATEALPITVLVLIVAGITAAWAYITRKSAKQPENDRPEDEQNSK